MQTIPQNLDTIEQGDKVFLRWHGNDNRPPYISAYTAVSDVDSDGQILIQGATTDNIFTVSHNSLILATEDPKGYVPGPRWYGYLLKLRDPEGHAARWAAYQASARKLTPTEIETIKQDGLKAFFDKAGL
jgi:hypothetical protein